MPDKPQFKRYWSEQSQEAGDDVCMNCGEQIDFENETGIIAIREDLGVQAPAESKIKLDKHIFCSECGTDVDVLHAIGMKRLIGFLNGPSGRLDRLVENGGNDGQVN